GTATTAAAPSTGTPALQADDGVGLPTASPLLLNGGVLQTHGTFNRGMGVNPGEVSWAWPTGATPGNQTAPGGGGFSAIGSQLTVDIGGAGAELVWGDQTFDAGLKILGPLKFGSGTSDAKTLFIDP